MICKQCKHDKLPGEFYWKNTGSVAYGQRCRECQNERWQSPEHKERQRAANLQRVYGISLEEYDSLWAKQGGVCAICKQESDSSGKNAKLHVDHDHETKRVRGLLCYRCNVAMGFLGEDLERIYAILDYLGLHSVTR